MLYVSPDSIIMGDFTRGYMLMTLTSLHVFSIIGPHLHVFPRHDDYMSSHLRVCEVKKTERISMFYSRN